MPIRIGAVSYLNTKPLIYQLREHLPNCTLELDLPSRLADRLSADELDVALIPSVEFLRGRDLRVVSDACIACHGPVRSVCVLFRKPPRQVETLALDEGSRTSAVLAQLLLWRQYAVRPNLRPLQINVAPRSVEADALLVIGDRAMTALEQHQPGEFVEAWDLGAEWKRRTGLPFVFAMWVTRNASLSPLVSHVFQAVRDAGLKHIDDIVCAEAPGYGLSNADCRRYFREQLHFVLGPRELAGLELFREQAIECDLLPPECQQMILEPIEC